MAPSKLERRRKYMFGRIALDWRLTPLLGLYLLRVARHSKNEYIHASEESQTHNANLPLTVPDILNHAATVTT
jgi:hypothetical protein